MTSFEYATETYQENALFSDIHKESKGVSQGIIDLRPRLTAILQRSLDLPELLTLFFSEIQSVVHTDSCRYENTAENVSIELGSKSSHPARFRLLTQDDFLGEVEFTRKTKFCHKEIKSLETLIATLIYPIRNALRYREALKSALTDSLTGAGNRVALNSNLNREFDLVTRHESPFSVLMVDIDRFKSINDRYGHAAGDHVLKSVVNEINCTIRCADMTFRLGGEEFVILLSNTGQEGALIIAERLRAAIAGLSCVYDEKEIPVTISIGAATWQQGESKEEILERADKAVYAAKKGGRNQVVAADIFEHL